MSTCCRRCSPNRSRSWWKPHGRAAFAGEELASAFTIRWVSNGSINVTSAKTKQRTKRGTPKRKLSNDVYEDELFRLQTEFVKLQEWVRYSGDRIVGGVGGRD